MANINPVWRDASRSPAFFGVVDARASLPLLFFVIFSSWNTFFIAIGSIVFFTVMGFLGYELPVLYRKTRSMLRGGRLYARPWWLLNKWRSK